MLQKDTYVFCRDQHECAAHVFWRKCTKALKRGYLLVISCFHSIWSCFGAGGWTQVQTLTCFYFYQSNISFQCQKLKKRVP